MKLNTKGSIKAPIQRYVLVGFRYFTTVFKIFARLVAFSGVVSIPGRVHKLEGQTVESRTTLLTFALFHLLLLILYSQEKYEGLER